MMALIRGDDDKVVRKTLETYFISCQHVLSLNDVLQGKKTATQKWK